MVLANQNIAPQIIFGLHTYGISSLANQCLTLNLDHLHPILVPAQNTKSVLLNNVPRAQWQWPGNNETLLHYCRMHQVHRTVLRFLKVCVCGLTLGIFLLLQIRDLGCESDNQASCSDMSSDLCNLGMKSLQQHPHCTALALAGGGPGSIGWEKSS